MTTNLTAWAIAAESLRGRYGSELTEDIVRVYHELCAQEGVEPDPTDLIGAYRGFTVEVDADGVATIQHRFEF